MSVCVLCASCLLLGCQLREFSGAVKGARYSISLLGSFSGLLDALGGGGGQGIPVRCFIRFALPCPAASCVGKPIMVVVAVQGPPPSTMFITICNCLLGQYMDSGVYRLFVDVTGSDVAYTFVRREDAFEGISEEDIDRATLHPPGSKESLA